MSFLVRYTLKSAEDHEAQAAAMRELTDGLKAEAISGVVYSGFRTKDPAVFIGVLEWEDENGKRGFLESASFARYRERVTPILAGPPETTDIAAVSSTRA